MQVKKFVAPNMRLALKQIREELGPDTVILSNKRVPEGVELMTAVDEPARPDPAEPTFSSNDSPYGVSESSNQPSKLEVEVERMQREAKLRAESLAATLNRNNQQAFADAMNETSDQVGDETNLVDDKVALSFAQQLATAKHDRNDEHTSTGGSASLAATDSAPSNADQVTTDQLKRSQQDSAQLVQTVLAASEAQMNQMREELHSMREVLASQLSSMAWGQFANNNPERASLWRRLTRMGIDSNVAESLLEGVSGEAGKPVWSQLMRCLQSEIPIVSPDLVAGGGIFTFVGPTGAGKTTTIGKLAARHVMDHGAEDIALVTTDTVRIAGHEQLRTVGRILNVPVQIVDQKNTLERVLYRLRHKKLVLVDTAGFSRQDERLTRQLQSLNELGDRVKTLLVLPSSSQVAVIKAAYHSYKTDNLSACVITKLDETASLGGVISLAIEKSLPIAYSSNGQDIPADIKAGDAGDLLRLTIELAKHQTINDVAMSEEYSALKVHSS